MRASKTEREILNFLCSCAVLCGCSPAFSLMHRALTTAALVFAGAAQNVAADVGVMAKLTPAVWGVEARENYDRDRCAAVCGGGPEREAEGERSWNGSVLSSSSADVGNSRRQCGFLLDFSGGVGDVARIVGMEIDFQGLGREGTRSSLEVYGTGKGVQLEYFVRERW